MWPDPVMTPDQASVRYGACKSGLSPLFDVTWTGAEVNYLTRIKDRLGSLVDI